MRKTLLILILLLGVAGCAVTLVRDDNPAAIETAFKRVETTICDHHEVGENGCVFPEGQVSGSLRIYRVLNGAIMIVGQGCQVDLVEEYAATGEEWIDFDLKKLVGEKLENDCVLDIYQRAKFPGSDKAQFKIYGSYGTVTLGVCPADAKCQYDGTQLRAGWHPDPLLFNALAAGQYVLRGGGKELKRDTFAGPLSLNLEDLWPGGYPSDGGSGTLFILGVKNTRSTDPGSLWKVYKKVWLFKPSTAKLTDPAFTVSTNKITFVGDSTVSLTLVDGKPVYGHQGSFKPSPNGNTIRFYTVSGRSLVVFFKDGVVQWAQ